MAKEDKKRRFSFVRVIRSLLVFCCIYWISGCALQRKIVFPAHVPNSMLNDSVVPGNRIERLEKHWITHDDGKTEYWLIKPEGASAAAPAPVVVFAHGNAELIDDQEIIQEGFNRLGFHVAMCEFRGYGRSGGYPSEKTIVADHVAMVDQLKQRKDVDSKRVIYYGRSIGGGVVCSLASKREPDAVILQSTFKSLTSMAARYGIPSLFVSDPFDSEAVLKQYKKPVLLMHGKNDGIIPHSHSVALKAAAPHAQLETFIAGHNNFPSYSTEHWAFVTTFLRKAKIMK